MGWRSTLNSELPLTDSLSELTNAQGCRYRPHMALFIIDDSPTYPWQIQYIILPPVTVMVTWAILGIRCFSWNFETEISFWHPNPT